MSEYSTTDAALSWLFPLLISQADNGKLMFLFSNEYASDMIRHNIKN